MQKQGILLTNLGTPSAPTTKAVRTYLNEFLSDKRVVALPAFIWQPILKLAILPFRPKKTAKNYQTIWQPDGSPLLNITKKQSSALQQKFNDVPVAFAMRYGNPSIMQGLQELKAQGVTELFVLPLYPQFSAATTTSTLDKIQEVFRDLNYKPVLHFLNHYADHPSYIDAVVESIENYWQENGRAENLLFSFHGLPQKVVDDGDPYYELCMTSAKLIIEKLSLDKKQCQITFQSRLGPSKWLQPYTIETLQQLPEKGIRNIDVVCPGFSADCLETLEEIDIQNRNAFLDAGGEKFRYIPALNDSAEHIECLAQLSREALKI